LPAPGREAAASGSQDLGVDVHPFGGTIVGVNGIMRPLSRLLAPRDPLCLDSDGLRTGMRCTSPQFGRGS
jgi:hypothetical protein